MVVTLLGGLRAGVALLRVAPLAALREVEVDTPPRSTVRAVVGVGGRRPPVRRRAPRQPGDGACRAPASVRSSWWSGWCCSGRSSRRPVGRNLLARRSALRGVSGDLARRNAVRNPKRTAVHRRRAARGRRRGQPLHRVRRLRVAVDRGHGRPDLRRRPGALTPAGSGFSGAGLSPDLVDQLDETPEVEVAAGLGFGAATLDGRNDDIGFADPQALAQVADFEMVEGDLADGRTTATSPCRTTTPRARLRPRRRRGGRLRRRRRRDAHAGGDLRPAGHGRRRPRATGVWTAHNPQASFFLIMVGLADGVSSPTGRAAVEAAPAGRARRTIRTARSSSRARRRRSTCSSR